METSRYSRNPCCNLGSKELNTIKTPKQLTLARVLVRQRRRSLPSVRSQGLSNIVPKKTSFTNANFPVDAEGRTYHLGTKNGEVANRILSVGSTQRALLLSGLLEPPAPGKPLFQLTSSRGFMTITGRFRGVPVSIISTHMGMPNMDFVVRESRAVVEGQLAIVRLGTCGAVQPPARLGQMLVASHGSICIRRNPDAWAPGEAAPPYTLSRPVPPDAELCGLLLEEAAGQVGGSNVVEGLNASADSFYSSQGRTGDDFDDRNAQLLDQVCSAYPATLSLEMETFQLLDLARCSGGSVRGVGMCIAIAERYSGDFLDNQRLSQAELAGGRAALAALARVALQGEAGPCTAAATTPHAAAAAAVPVPLLAGATASAKGPAGSGRGNAAVSAAAAVQQVEYVAH